MSQYDIEIFRSGKCYEAMLVQNVPGVDEYIFKSTGKAETLEIRLLIPIAGTAGYWHASRLPGPKMHLDWNIDFVCGGQFNFPGLFLLDRACHCLYGITLTDIWDDARFTAVLDQENEQYKITVSVAESSETKDFTLRIDHRGVTVDQAVKEWRENLSLPIYQFPDSAWDGVFCTWYAKHGAVDAAWLEPAAQRAADLGFKTLIVDDGWCYDEYCRVNPETLTNWYRTIGDYQISNVKFPNFIEHVQRVRNMGMKYLVWVAPHLIGCESDFYSQYPDSVLEPLVEGQRRLNVKNLVARQQLTERLTALMHAGNFDGLKIDFIDIVRPNPAEPNSRETLAFAKQLTDAVRAVKSDALIEFRKGYANCAMLLYATQFRAGDAPFDALTNFGRIAEIRLAMGSGVPIHADPAFWSKSDPAENVARHMIAMLGGVPMLSMDLLKLNAMEEKIIRLWMDFYQQHQKLLNHGIWTIEMNHQDIAAMTVENDNEKIILLNDSHYISEIADSPGKTVYLANLSERPVAWQADKVKDVTGNINQTSSIPVGGCGMRR